MLSYIIISETRKARSFPSETALHFSLKLVCPPNKHSTNKGEIMLSKVTSYGINGLDAYPVTIEIRLGRADIKRATHDLAPKS